MNTANENTKDKKKTNEVQTEPKKVYHKKREIPKPEIKRDPKTFIPRAVINDIKSEKNGTKKAVFWVKKKKRDEDGTVKGEKWVTNQQYIGDWKENKMHGYGVKIYDNKDKYEGYWVNGKREGKGTYWLCIGKNKFRKLYTGDWKTNQKEGHGIFFYKDGSCYDGIWKNSKRNGKGLMMYANQDIYEGEWQDDKREGYGVLEKKNGDKYYGHWHLNLKEGQGYYYYHSTSKIYLGEWHEDNPRCGIFTDVEDEAIQNELQQIEDAKERPSKMPILKLANPEKVLEESMANVHFLRNIKRIKNKNIEDLYDSRALQEMTRIYSELRITGKKDDENEPKYPDHEISRDNLSEIIRSNLNYDLKKETLELIFYALELPLFEDTKIDFLLFVKIYYLIQQKIKNEENVVNEEGEEDMEENNRYNEDEEEGDINQDGEEYNDNEELNEDGEEYNDNEELNEDGEENYEEEQGDVQGADPEEKNLIKDLKK